MAENAAEKNRYMKSSVLKRVKGARQGDREAERGWRHYDISEAAGLRVLPNAIGFTSGQIKDVPFALITLAM
jgi:hypothetical protein